MTDFKPSPEWVGWHRVVIRAALIQLVGVGVLLLLFWRLGL